MLANFTFASEATETVSVSPGLTTVPSGGETMASAVVPCCPAADRAPNNASSTKAGDTQRGTLRTISPHVFGFNAAWH
jgi:hypothetical protein